MNEGLFGGEKAFCLNFVGVLKMGLLPIYGFFGGFCGSLWAETSKWAYLFRFSLSLILCCWMVVCYFIWKSAIFWFSTICSCVGIPLLLELVIRDVFVICCLLFLPWFCATNMFKYDASWDVNFPSVSAPDNICMSLMLPYDTFFRFRLVVGLLAFRGLLCRFIGVKQRLWWAAGVKFRQVGMVWLSLALRC